MTQRTNSTLANMLIPTAGSHHCLYVCFLLDATAANETARGEQALATRGLCITTCRMTWCLATLLEQQNKEQQLPALPHLDRSQPTKASCPSTPANRSLCCVWVGRRGDSVNGTAGLVRRGPQHPNDR